MYEIIEWPTDIRSYWVSERGFKMNNKICSCEY